MLQHRSGNMSSRAKKSIRNNSCTFIANHLYLIKGRRCHHRRPTEIRLMYHQEQN